MALIYSNKELTPVDRIAQTFENHGIDFANGISSLFSAVVDKFFHVRSLSESDPIVNGHESHPELQVQFQIKAVNDVIFSFVKRSSQLGHFGILHVQLVQAGFGIRTQLILVGGVMMRSQRHARGGDLNVLGVLQSHLERKSFVRVKADCIHVKIVQLLSGQPFVIAYRKRSTHAAAVQAKEEREQELKYNSLGSRVYTHYTHLLQSK